MIVRATRIVDNIGVDGAATGRCGSRRPMSASHTRERSREFRVAEPEAADGGVYVRVHVASLVALATAARRASGRR